MKNNDLGGYICFLRERAGYTQAELASLIGATQFYISYLDSVYHLPKRQVINTILFKEEGKMSATKEQERNALEKIKKIVSDLGEISYLKTAFDGCFEIAESNIDNDFGESLKDNLEFAEKKIEQLSYRVEQLQCENAALHKDLTTEKEHNVSKKSLEIAAEATRKVKGDYLEEVIKLKNTIVDNAETPDLPVFKEAVQRYKFLKNECEEYAKALSEIQDKM